jgi:phosphotransferase system enzyme I (PtsI)
MSKASEMRVLKGIPASPGIAFGRFTRFSNQRLTIDEREILQAQVADEIERLRQSIALVRSDLIQTRDLTKDHYSSEMADIFTAQIAILEDQIFLSEIESAIHQRRKHAEFVVYDIFKERQEYFRKQQNQYFQDRAWDIQALKRQIIAKLQGKEESYHLSVPSIIVAENLSPRDTVHFDRKKILGFAIDHGGSTSHSAILARSLEVPCVVGLHNVSNTAADGSYGAIDGYHGHVVIHPSAAEEQRLLTLKERLATRDAELLRKANLPLCSKCGEAVQLLANLELQDEVEAVHLVGAKGIGLLRTEGLFLASEELPDEERQTAVYTQVAAAMAPLPVTIRTLDIGGDKAISQIAFPPENNPFLGWRAIRFSLDSEAVFKQQLRAILRAGYGHNIRIMLPLISNSAEITASRQLLDICKDELAHDGFAFAEDIELGIMIETPAAAILAADFAEQVDFFSIGTNDLTQYTLAADRGNEKIAHLYSHFHPAVIRLIASVLRTGHEKGIPVSLCGEMAGDTRATALLLGLGLRCFSAAPIVIPAVAKIIRETDLDIAQELANQVMAMNSHKQIENYLEEYSSRLLEAN